MSIASPAVLVICLLVGAAAEAASPVEAFDREGVVVNVHELFPAVAQAAADKRAGAISEASVAGRAFVTAEGVYAFLETPENKQVLANIASGSAVRLQGKLLPRGSLLHVAAAAPVGKRPEIDLRKYAAERGVAVELTGTNKCQCGLDVGDLPRSCTLGHLHHLDADDGKVYHYLQIGDGQTAFLGKGTHFKKVAVQGRVFPGQFVLVERGNVQP